MGAEGSRLADASTAAQPGDRQNPFTEDFGKVAASLLPRANNAESNELQKAQQWASPVPGAHRVEPTPAQDLAPGDLQPQQVDQMVGAASLPAALGDAERALCRTRHEQAQIEQTIKKLLPLATFDLLPLLPPNILQATGLAGQTLRRRLVHGTTVVFYNAGYAGKRFVFERAKKLGIRTVVIDEEEVVKDGKKEASWVRGMEDEGLIAKFIPINMNRPDKDVLRDALEAIEALGKDGRTGKADAVLTMAELALPMVARLCERLGLPGHTPEAADTARDKDAVRTKLAEKGVRMPKYFLIKHPGEVAAAGEHVGFPAVLKPKGGAASLGVKKVTCQEELQGCYAEVVHAMGGFSVKNGALVQERDASGAEQGVPAKKMDVLLEEYLDGQEVDVDMVLSNGALQYCCITDNGPTAEPYCNETWGVCPSMLDTDKQRALKELAFNCVTKLGFSSGVFHVECKYTTKNEAHLVEVNARMGGGPVHEWNLRTWNVDLVEESIFCALGIPARPHATEAPMKSTAFYLVTAPMSGTVVELPDLDGLKKRDPSVVWCNACKRKGDEVTGPDKGMPEWLLDIVAFGNTSREVRDHIFKIAEQNPVKVKAEGTDQIYMLHEERAVCFHKDPEDDCPACNGYNKRRRTTAP